MRTPRDTVLILSVDDSGPVYLGRLDCGNQGVRRLENANLYTARGARQLAAQYPGATIAPAFAIEQQAETDAGFDADASHERDDLRDPCEHVDRREIERTRSGATSAGGSRK